MPWPRLLMFFAPLMVLRMPRLLPAFLLPLGMMALHAEDDKTRATQQLTEAQQRLKKLSSVEYDLDGLRINAETREIRIPTKVELKKAPIEYMLVHETGKTHESVLTTAVSPTAIQLALLLTNYEAASEGILAKVPKADLPPWKEKAPAKPNANRLKIRVEWKVAGETKSAPLSDWVQDNRTKKSPADLQTWVFNGSILDERGFVAESEGSIISVWVDQAALINSPAEGNWRDELWFTHTANIPEEGTEVSLIIYPASP